MPRRTATSPPKKRARGTLSREEVLRAALRLVETEGLAALTLRRLATDLGVVPMAVYRHVRDKEEILDGLLDLIIADAAPTDHDERDWRDWTVTTFLRMREALVRHPDVMPLLGTSASYGPNALRVLEEVLRVLRGAGLDDARAAQAFHLLVSFTIGSTAIELASRVGAAADGEAIRRLRARFESISLSDHPHVVAAAPALAASLSPVALERGLRLLLTSLA